MAKFRKLTLGRLPRVMVHTLALGAGDSEEVSKRVRHEASLSAAPWAVAVTEVGVGIGWRSLAPAFAAVLDLSKVDRAPFVRVLDKILDGLLAEDFFGTEGQCDPRGDHRD